MRMHDTTRFPCRRCNLGAVCLETQHMLSADGHKLQRKSCIGMVRWNNGENEL
jgi:hypothetical protein